MKLEGGRGADWFSKLLWVSSYSNEGRGISRKQLSELMRVIMNSWSCLLG